MVNERIDELDVILDDLIEIVRAATENNVLPAGVSENNARYIREVIEAAQVSRKMQREETLSWAH